MFDVTAAYVVSLFVSSIFFGFSCATFFLCIRKLCDAPFRTFTRVRWTLFIVCCGMLVIGGTSIGQQLRHNLNAFVYYKGGKQATEELNDPRDPTNYIHTATYPIQSFLGDSVLVYRTYVVYNCDWRMIVVPILLMLGDTAAGFGITYAESQLKQGAYTDPSLQPWMMSFFTLTLCLNLLCTGMIIFRIVRVSNESAANGVTRSGSGSVLNKLVRIIVESGLIYTTHSLILLVTVMSRSLALYPVADSFIQTTPICFHLIIIRTGWHRQASSTQVPTLNISRLRFKSMGQAGSSLPTSDTFRVGGAMESGEASLKYDDPRANTLPMEPIGRSEIVVTQEQWTKSDRDEKISV